MTKLLLVDDEPHILELEQALFESEGFEVLTAKDGESALAILKMEKPDLAILDMMMPGMSGRELCEKIRADPNTKDLKVIFVTVARFSEIGKNLLKEMNVSDYITKPFENEDVIKRVKKILKD